MTATTAIGEPRSREARLGLVLYGGVSLAIYINGVTQEFFNAVRGRGVYRLIKCLTDSDIVVDIVSGTSAGGINGIYLAYALCNQREFSAFSDLWRESGDLRRLLRRPDRDHLDTPSLLNSEGYYQPQLQAAFGKMPAIDAGEMEDVSAFSELDLFITGTDIDGAVSTQFDDSGHPIDVKDHRAKFVLKHRGMVHPGAPPEGRKTPFRPGDVTHEALAKLSRITSCFPGAFAPVPVANVPPGEGSADALLQNWGRLNKSAWFVDGGVLDNKPFTHTLNAIFHRTADRDVERMLFYVEPDPEHFDPNLTPAKPTFLRATMDSLIGIPGYESIADDLSMLAQHNSRLELYRRLLEPFLKRFRSGERTGEATWRDVEPRTLQVLYLQSRLTQLSERALLGVLKTEGKAGLMDQERRRAASVLVRSFDQWREVDDWEAAYGLILQPFDVYYRLRRLFRITYSIFGALSPRDGAPAPDDQQRRRYRILWRAVNRQIELLEILLSVMETLVDETDIDWQAVVRASGAPSNEVAQSVWVQVQALMQGLLEDLSILPAGYREAWGEGAAELTAAQRHADLEGMIPETKQLSGMLGRMRARAAVLKARPPEPLENAPPAGVLAETDAYEERLFRALCPDDADPVWNAYRQFVLLDAHLNPIELVAGLAEKDVIKTTRISPLDAQRGFSERRIDEKISGDSVHHFGGFLKRSWRSNDILWGRLDGVCQLLECLFTRDRLRWVLSDDARRQSILARLRADLDVGEVFPSAGAAAGEIGAYLEELCEAAPAERDRLLDDKFVYYQRLMIECAQLEILAQGVPRVVEDAIAEQSEWNQFRLPAARQEEKERSGRPLLRYDVREAVFQPGDGDLDPVVVSAAAGEAARIALQQLAEGAGPAARPAQTPLGRFFRQNYRVGTEDVMRDIPQVVLLEMLAQALLVMRNIVLTLFGSRGAEMRKNNAFILLVDWPLRVFHTWILFWRRSPAELRYRRLVLVLLSIFALAVAVIWTDPVLHHAGDFHRLSFLLMVVLPLVILVPIGVGLWRKNSGRLRWVERTAGALLALASLAALAVAAAVLVLWYDQGGPFVAGLLGLDWPWRPGAHLAFTAATLLLIPLAALLGFRYVWRKGHPRAASEAEIQAALERLAGPQLYRIAGQQGVDAESHRWERLTPAAHREAAARMVAAAGGARCEGELLAELDAFGIPARPGVSLEDLLWQCQPSDLRRLGHMFGVTLPAFDPALAAEDRQALARTVTAKAKDTRRLAELESAIRNVDAGAFQECGEAELRQALETFFPSNRLRTLAHQPPQDAALTADERRKMAASIVETARNQGHLAALEGEMRSLNPSALC